MPTLEELDGEIWGEPELNSHLIVTCHRLRKKPIDEFTTEDLRIMIGQNIGLQFLVSKAVERLENDSLAEGDYYPGDLLNNVITRDPSFYERSPQIVARIVAVAQMVADQLRESQDDPNLAALCEQFVNKYAT